MASTNPSSPSQVAPPASVLVLITYRGKISDDDLRTVTVLASDGWSLLHVPYDMCPPWVQDQFANPTHFKVVLPLVSPDTAHWISGRRVLAKADKEDELRIRELNISFSCEDSPEHKSVVFSSADAGAMVLSRTIDGQLSMKTLESYLQDVVDALGTKSLTKSLSISKAIRGFYGTMTRSDLDQAIEGMHGHIADHKADYELTMQKTIPPSSSASETDKRVIITFRIGAASHNVFCPMATDLVQYLGKYLTEPNISIWRTPDMLSSGDTLETLKGRLGRCALAAFPERSPVDAGEPIDVD
ncbi:hypothetical protein M231_00986 [Tremella mesenterica]|uniref:Uncharacterized protein n=1 Tax=Tremella mesenterica TaxID=5217 RepID=A0A4Q1BUG4_TREME|nr:hypothetical protein M231_00986 [Tremella mesenterica]